MVNKYFFLILLFFVNDVEENDSHGNRSSASRLSSETSSRKNTSFVRQSIARPDKSKLAEIKPICPRRMEKACRQSSSTPHVCTNIEGRWQCVCPKFQIRIMSICMKFVTKHCDVNKTLCQETFVKYQCHCFKFDYDKMQWKCTEPFVYPTEHPCPPRNVSVSETCDRKCGNTEICCFRYGYSEVS